METKDGKLAIYAPTRKDWLVANRNSQTEKISCGYYTNSTVTCIQFSEATEEALCFGWIDSLVQKTRCRKLLSYLFASESKNSQ